MSKSIGESTTAAAAAATTTSFGIRFSRENSARKRNEREREIKR